jgi:predicted lipoprotein with Yx(FWY)xxD motif
MAEGTEVRTGRRSWLRRGLLLAVGVPLVVAMMAACGNPGGGSTSGGNTGSSTTGSSGGSGGSATVNVCKTTLGDVLCGSNGMTLYTYSADSTDKSACTQQSCYALWPLLTVSGTPTAGAGVTGKLGTITTDGKTQVTYNGKPLYYYVSDKKPGDVTGQNVTDSLGTWFVAKP